MPQQERVRAYRDGIVPVDADAIDRAIKRFNAAHPKAPYTNDALAAAVTERGVKCSLSNIKSMRAGSPTRTEVVEIVADLLGRSVHDFIDLWERLECCNSNLEVRDLAHERIVEGLRHFRLPLAEPTVEDLLRAVAEAERIAEPTATQTVLSLEKADLLDRFSNVLSLVATMAPTERFARLKDVLDDLRAEGIHVLTGRYVERYFDEEGLERLEMGLDAEPQVRAVLVLRFSDAHSEPDYVVDRSEEPTQSSWIEAIDPDDGPETHKHLARLEAWNGGPIHAAFAPTPA